MIHTHILVQKWKKKSQENAQESGKGVCGGKYCSPVSFPLENFRPTSICSISMPFSVNSFISASTHSFKFPNWCMFSFEIRFVLTLLLLLLHLILHFYRLESAPSTLFIRGPLAFGLFYWIAGEIYMLSI